MTTINYTKGDATSPIGEGPKIIVHGCNSLGCWGAGFVLAVSRRWRKPERDYREWHRKYKPLHLGWIQVVKVDHDLFVANCIIQDSIGPLDEGPRVDYHAVRRCFQSVASNTEEFVPEPFSVHMPRIGCGLAGGSWSEIEPIIKDEFCTKEIQVTVYDL